MALSAETLTQNITDHLKAAGFDVEQPDCLVAALASAVAKAVVASITDSAEVTILGGSSKGTYKVE